jgi:hypothetical protein
MEYSELKETDGFKLLVDSIENDLLLSCTIDGIAYEFNDVSDLFNNTRQICQHADPTSEKYTYKMLLDPAFYKIQAFIGHCEDADKLMASFSGMSV